MMIKRILMLVIMTVSFYGYIASTSADNYNNQYSGTCQWYADPFGPLKSGYTMGDLMRYSVANNNYLYGFVKPTELATQVKICNQNIANLYNAVGYLYAGWIVFNDKTIKRFTEEWFLNAPSQDHVTSSIATKLSLKPSLWINDYRNNLINNPAASSPNPSVHEFDNNAQGVNCCAPLLTSDPVLGVGWHQPNTSNGDDIIVASQGGFSQDGVQLKNAVASLGWCSNTSVGDFVVYFNLPTNPNYNLVYPLIQFFGARIAHILGVVVNDIPWSDDNSASGATIGSASPTPAFTNPLISSFKALPMFAVMSGGPYASASTAPKGMIQTSTAHYGSINTFLSKLTQSPPTTLTSATQDVYNYLKYHLQPTVARLSTLFSYGINTSGSYNPDKNSLNLITINDANVTSMDQGVIACIENNTGVGLVVSQIASGMPQEIGILDGSENFNNFYLNLASLVSTSTSASSSTPSITSTLSTATNMITIEDLQTQSLLKNTNYKDLKIALYVQVLQEADMIALVTAFNSLQSGGYSYNQTQAVPTSLSGNYLVVTNFDPTLSSSSSSSSSLSNASQDPNVIDSYRMHFIDIDQFLNKPYYLTLQINKENVAYGLLTPGNTQNAISKSKLNDGVKNVPFLYPSFSGVKTFTWQNIYHARTGGFDFSKIPLLLMPEDVYIYNAGVLIYYVIWTVAYAAALTECSYNGVDFENTVLLHKDVFGLYSKDSRTVDLINVGSGYSSTSYKCIVDAQGFFSLGSTLDLSDFSIASSATLDAGGNLHQDISVLNLSSSGLDVRGNSIVVPNSQTSEYLNLSATIGTLKKNVPAKFRDLNQNVVLFSLPSQAIKDGVNIQITKKTPEFNPLSTNKSVSSSTSMPNSTRYEFIITSTKDFTDSNGILYKAGSVLVARKVTIDTTFYDISNIVFDFLHLKNDTTWTSLQSISDSVENFSLTYSSISDTNKLSIGASILSGKSSSLIDNFISYPIDMKQTVISSFNIDMPNHGFSFIQNPWNPQQICSVDIAPVFGLTDFKVAMIGIDSDNKPVLNSANKSNLDSLVIYLFDKNNKQIGNPLPVSYDANGLLLSVAQKSFDDIDQPFSLGLNSKLYPVTFNYPFVIEFKNVKPFGFANTYQQDLKNSSLDSFNINTKNLGFSFIKNPWSSVTQVLPVSADISSAIAGKKDFKIMVMGADKNNLPILTINNNSKVDHLNVYIYDESNTLIKEPIAIPLDSNHVYNFTTKSSTGITVSTILAEAGSTFDFGVNGQDTKVTLSYPFVIEFTNVKPSMVAPKSKKPKAKAVKPTPATSAAPTTLAASAKSTIKPKVKPAKSTSAEKTTAPAVAD